MMDHSKTNVLAWTLFQILLHSLRKTWNKDSQKSTRNISQRERKRRDNYQKLRLSIVSLRTSISKHQKIKRRLQNKMLKVWDKNVRVLIHQKKDCLNKNINHIRSSKCSKEESQDKAILDQDVLILITQEIVLSSNTWFRVDLKESQIMGC